MVGKGLCFGCESWGRVVGKGLCFGCESWSTEDSDRWWGRHGLRHTSARGDIQPPASTMQLACYVHWHLFCLGGGLTLHITHPMMSIAQPHPLLACVPLLQFVGTCCELQTFGGLELSDIEDVWWVLYTVLVVAVVVTFLLLQQMASRKPKSIHYVGVEMSGSQAHATTTGTTYEEECS